MSTGLPAFSVLMSSYNKGKYISEAIESVLKQTFSDWELVIIDDGSTDGSIEIIRKYLNDKRIKLFKNDSNKGCPYTLNRMMRRSKGEIIGILDSDDVLTEDAIEEVMKAYSENPKCGFFYSRYTYCDENLDYLSEGDGCRIEAGKNNIHRSYSSAFRAYTREAFNMTNGYREEKIYAEDRDLILRLEELVPFYFIDRVLYKYRILDNSQSNDPGTKIIGALVHIDSKLEAYKRRLGTNIPNLTKKEMSLELIDAIFFSLKIGDPKKALGYLGKTIVINPLYIFGYAWIVIRIIKFIPYRIFSLVFSSKNA